eukprot:TRINITY_DN18636_c0_g1_i1.p1 TRINITY_DN18636_c0_g1~~TRINITY_DN18636_c0_g1_i1.p1  ORF type:complete len:907 (+),score=72.02 TRINITY_DN18636_c0_g1_i1:25-2745(+)
MTPAALALLFLLTSARQISLDTTCETVEILSVYSDTHPCRIACFSSQVRVFDLEVGRKFTCAGAATWHALSPEDTCTVVARCSSAAKFQLAQAASDIYVFASWLAKTAEIVGNVTNLGVAAYDGPASNAVVSAESVASTRNLGSRSVPKLQPGQSFQFRFSVDHARQQTRSPTRLPTRVLTRLGTRSALSVSRLLTKTRMTQSPVLQVPTLRPTRLPTALPASQFTTKTITAWQLFPVLTVYLSPTQGVFTSATVVPSVLQISGLRFAVVGRSVTASVSHVGRYTGDISVVFEHTATVIATITNYTNVNQPELEYSYHLPESVFCALPQTGTVVARISGPVPSACGSPWTADRCYCILSTSVPVSVDLGPQLNLTQLTPLAPVIGTPLQLQFYNQGCQDSLAGNITLEAVLAEFAGPGRNIPPAFIMESATVSLPPIPHGSFVSVTTDLPVIFAGLYDVTVTTQTGMLSRKELRQLNYYSAETPLVITENTLFGDVHVHRTVFVSNFSTPRLVLLGSAKRSTLTWDILFIQVGALTVSNAVLQTTNSVRALSACNISLLNSHFLVGGNSTLASGSMFTGDGLLKLNGTVMIQGQPIDTVFETPTLLTGLLDLRAGRVVVSSSFVCEGSIRLSNGTALVLSHANHPLTSSRCSLSGDGEVVTLTDWEVSSTNISRLLIDSGLVTVVSALRVSTRFEVRPQGRIVVNGSLWVGGPAIINGTVVFANSSNCTLGNVTLRSSANLKIILSNATASEVLLFSCSNLTGIDKVKFDVTGKLSPGYWSLVQSGGPQRYQIFARFSAAAPPTAPTAMTSSGSAPSPPSSSTPWMVLAFSALGLALLVVIGVVLWLRCRNSVPSSGRPDFSVPYIEMLSDSERRLYQYNEAALCEQQYRQRVCPAAEPRAGFRAA